jgi:hypothetical protein
MKQAAMGAIQVTARPNFPAAAGFFGGHGVELRMRACADCSTIGTPSHAEAIILATCALKDGAMPSSKNPIRSRSRCPQCGGPLYYIDTFFSFLTGKKRRICLARNCTFEDARRFKIVVR